MRNEMKPRFYWTLVLLLGLSGMGMAEHQGWLNNSISLKVNSRISLKFTQEVRHSELTFTEGYLHNWQGGAIWKSGSRTHLAVFYKRETVDKLDGNQQENRFTLEGGWKLPLTRNTNLDLRFRTEIRRFEDHLAENHLRFRLRLRLVTQVKIGALTLKPFVAIEPFADTKADKINRNRIYLGTVIPLSTHLEWVVNYIRQDTSGKDPLHILNTGVALKF